MTETLQRLQAAVLPRLRARLRPRLRFCLQPQGARALRRLAPLPWRVHG